MRPAQPNQSLIDGLACLQALTSHGEPIGSRELGRMLGLESTRANRLLKTLAYVGLAQQDASRRYFPGPGVHVLAAQSMRGSGLVRRAFGPLEALASGGLHVSMGVLWRDQVCYLYHTSDELHGANIGGAPLFPAARSGIGHVLLAAQDDDAIRAVFDGSSPRADAVADLPASPPELGRLLDEIHAVRTQGFAVVATSDEDRTVAVALESDAAAIGVFGTFDDDEIPALVRRIHETARQIDHAGAADPSPTLEAHA
ncbi:MULTISPECIES: IclR family transcriptional regulator [unclassified Isoptericola]|uniref:IclR family transcriptional regulator n=1 Tax=unclassified Isoptericola TaxID=2623355 RepID=UPI003652570E